MRFIVLAFGIQTVNQDDTVNDSFSIFTTNLYLRDSHSTLAVLLASESGSGYTWLRDKKRGELLPVIAISESH